MKRSAVVPFMHDLTLDERAALCAMFVFKMKNMAPWLRDAFVEAAGGPLSWGPTKRIDHAWAAIERLQRESTEETTTYSSGRTTIKTRKDAADARVVLVRAISVICPAAGDALTDAMENPDAARAEADASHKEDL